ncbi:transport permease protein [Streptomyces nigrescens]|uniref:Transport permease protein n=2 Tax=Streptomyces TaxID=1883 RepID=A0ABM7ZY25_STRNI|nr:ABC transporter permease [Streptomyces nigrescens]MEE4421608.1 ABC transporter permease [Streptomyces sp. DSM 41528]BDM71277.1 transport permease protein [Streptomyces nigrescens]
MTTSSLLTDQLAVRPTTARTFLAMMARELRVMRRNFASTFVRVLSQPLFFVFVFAYVLPKLGSADGGMFSGRGNGPTYSTVLVPGLIGSSVVMQAMMAAVMPLMMELSWQRSITERALAPLSIPLLGIQKTLAAGLQGLLGGLLVLPAVVFIHAEGQAPDIEIANWPLFLVVLVAGSLLAAATGLLMGTLISPEKVQMLFTVVLLPMTMLGCVYYSWSAMSSIAWLQILVLVNPMVYLSEGLRAALTPQIAHMPAALTVTVLVVGTLVVGWFGMRSFTRRVVA